MHRKMLDIYFSCSYNAYNLINNNLLKTLTRKVRFQHFLQRASIAEKKQKCTI